MNKKMYVTPASEVIELLVKNNLLSGSIGDIETGGGGEVTPSTGDPTDPDWGSDY